MSHSAQGSRVPKPDGHTKTHMYDAHQYYYNVHRSAQIFYYTIYSIMERSFGTVSSYTCRGLFLIELVAVQ